MTPRLAQLRHFFAVLIATLFGRVGSASCSAFLLWLGGTRHVFSTSFNRLREPQSSPFQDVLVVLSRAQVEKPCNAGFRHIGREGSIQLRFQRLFHPSSKGEHGHKCNLQKQVCLLLIVPISGTKYKTRDTLPELLLRPTCRCTPPSSSKPGCLHRVLGQYKSA